MVERSRRVEVAKTYKLYIDGKFPRSESGRTLLAASPSGPAHACRASRKDLRDAVEAARKAFDPWASASAYLRGQILYRMAEMLEAKRAEFVALMTASPREGRARGSNPGRGADAEVSATIDRLVHFAGWTDKYTQVMGSHNPVTGPYYNFSSPEPVGVVAVIAPDAPALFALAALLAPVIAAGNTAVVIAGDRSPLVASSFGEVCATSDLPGGVVNILTGVHAELLPHVASHRGIDAVHAGGLDAESAAALRAGVAENLKRVSLRPASAFTLARAAAFADGPRWIEPFVEIKTIWHPSAT